MYMLRQHAIEGGMFRGTVSRVDYASYLYWRERRELDRSIRNVFGAAALHSADGALLLGIMGPHTANAGLIYPPSGSPDDDDVKAGRLDLPGNIVREVAEETGIALALPDRPSWLAVDDGPRIALLLPVSLPGSAEELVGRIGRHLSREPVPELAGIHVVRGRADIVPERMQPYTLAYIHHVFAS
jgi:8-oxo-dGTP pyrophosphatase MutT (NUDIX family)